MSGYIGYRAIGDFIKRNRTDLLAILKPRKGRLPSFDVIRQILMRLDFKEVSTQFHNWAKKYIDISEREWVSVDGKAIGGTVSNGQSIDQHFVSLMSLYCSRQKLVFGNAQVSNSNALHCQKATTEAIINSKNDYLIGVKKNQPTLQGQIESIIADKKNQSSSYTTIEINKGRTELRHTMVSDCIESISKDWKGLRQLVGVHRIVKEKEKTREEMAYFISSREGNAFLYSEGVRSHWEIENSLHWLKDVTMGEDASKIRMGNAPQNISTIKNIGINIFRKNNHGNIAQAIRLVANNIHTLNKLITWNSTALAIRGVW